MKPTFDRTRALSWSAISSFEYNKKEWYNKYVLGHRQRETPEMAFGKVIGERLASDPEFLPEVPRLAKFEHAFNVMFAGIPLVGYADTFCTSTKRKLYEYKTGVKPWTKKRADEHGQIDMYALLHYITEKIPPEDVEFKLVWLPTKRVETGDFKVIVSLVLPVVPQIFTTKRTMLDIIAMGARIKRTYKEMILYCELST